MEEIIIDGVDVAGCCYYEPKNDTGEWCDLTCIRDNAPVFRCEKMPSCYYKQLKRLEQENSNLREAMHKDFCSHYVLGECSQDHHNNCVGRKQCIKDLEQENAELKERLKILDDEEFVYEVSEIEYNNFKKMNDYKQALEEIREIAENSCDIPCAGHNCDCENCKDEITNNGETCMQYGLDKITNKINEVLR